MELEAQIKRLRRTILVIALVFGISGIGAVMGSYHLNSTADANFNASVWWAGLLQNFGTEMFGALATFVLLEIVLHNQDKRREYVEAQLQKQREDYQRKRDEQRREQQQKRDAEQRAKRQQDAQKRGEKKVAVYRLLESEIKEAEKFRKAVKKELNLRY